MQFVSMGTNTMGAQSSSPARLKEVHYEIDHHVIEVIFAERYHIYIWRSTDTNQLHSGHLATAK